MYYKLAVFIFMFSLSLLSVDYYVPVVASAEGAYGSQWQTSLAIFNAGHNDVTLNLSFIPTGEKGNISQKEIFLNAGECYYADDLLLELSAAGLGALKISAPEFAVSNLGIISKVYNQSENGRFGQAISILQENKILEAPQEYFLILPENEASERFNFGLFSIQNTQIKFQLLNQNGEMIGEVLKSYPFEHHEQYNQGYKNFFQTNQTGRVIKAIMTEGKAIIYGSQVDNQTNDGAFFLAQSLKSNEVPYLLGVDAGANGTLDYKDENKDNILDSPVVFNEGYPFDYVFMIKAKDIEGDPITFKILNAPKGMTLLSSTEGKIYYDPDKTDINKTINLEVELSDGLGKAIVIIPLQVNP